MKSLFKDKLSQQKVRKAADISMQILLDLRAHTVEGSCPLEINKLALSLCKKNKVIPSFLGVPGIKTDFPGNLCVCVNDETLHAIPFSKVPFKSGDIIKIDFGVIYEGIFTDHCVTVGLGHLDKEEIRLIETTKLAIQTAVKQAYEGNHVGDISNVIEQISTLAGFQSIHGYAGHGIGYSIHENPSIPYTGKPNTGPKLEKGMLLCIETQLSLGTGKLSLDKDGWTLRTIDGAKTAMFEHMVLVDSKPEVLTAF